MSNLNHEFGLFIPFSFSIAIYAVLIVLVEPYFSNCLALPSMSLTLTHLVHLWPPEHFVLMTRHRSQACDVRTREECEAGACGPGGGCGGMALLRRFCWPPRPPAGGRATDIAAWCEASPPSCYQRAIGHGCHINCTLERGRVVSGSAACTQRNLRRWSTARYLYHCDGEKFRYSGERILWYHAPPASRARWAWLRSSKAMVILVIVVTG